MPSVAAIALPDDEDQEEQEDSAAEHASWTRERSIAEALVGKVMQQWQGPISTLSRAGKAFEGLEALLGGAQGGGFDLGVSSLGPLDHMYRDHTDCWFGDVKHTVCT